ncbi:Catechol 2,3-dioxygenase [Variovorax sp. HW608]|uniref:VOC family protein n=1 Tax=Variovorax sp. HW608 TaxID=1034889 RepID=UPI00081FBDC0|nr:VOC family protein [Variovorax sp. HW608]SCK14970.1 Catechol 2,3-dioxygenase [Variovorax sp. HW608]
MSYIRELVPDAHADPKTEASVVKPYAMTHGTLECRNMAVSRKFYEEFLGLEVVQHSPVSMGLRCGFKFHIVCVEVGDAVHNMSYLTHWGLDVRSREEVDAAYAATQQQRGRWGIQNMTEPVDQHGVYSFYLQDLDNNWWEVQYYSAGYQHEDMFDFGDRYESSLKQRA